MKVIDVVRNLNLDLVCPGDQNRDVTGVITGDLMSFIVGRATSGSVWITVQNHLNVAAVAVLKDIPLIIISSGRPLMEDLRARCEMENVALALSGDSSFCICSKLSDLGFSD